MRATQGSLRGNQIVLKRLRCFTHGNKAAPPLQPLGLPQRDNSVQSSRKTASAGTVRCRTGVIRQLAQRTEHEAVRGPWHVWEPFARPL